MWAPEASSQASTTSKVHSTASWKEITPHQNCPTLLPPARRKSTEDGSIPNPQNGLPLHQPCLETQNPSVSENSLNGHATRCFETISLLFKQRFMKSHEPYHKKKLERLSAKLLRLQGRVVSPPPPPPQFLLHPNNSFPVFISTWFSTSGTRASHRTWIKHATKEFKLWHGQNIGFQWNKTKS